MAIGSPRAWRSSSISTSTRPEPPLIPADPADQAHVRALALTIACDIHPLNNLRVLKYLEGPLHQEQEARTHGMLIG
jgi:glutathione S-transferase